MARRPVTRKDRTYARSCVRLIEDLHEGKITRVEFDQRLRALSCWNNKGPEKPEKPVPPARLPGLDGVTRA